MLRLIGTYDIPEWAIYYLEYNDASGLTDEEAEEVNKFQDSLINKYQASRIIYDTEVMNEEKYGNFFCDEINFYPDFGEQFGACKTWKIPVYVDTNDEKDTRVNIVIMGENPLNNRKFEVNIFQNKSFCDLDEADIWVNAYFDFLNNFDYCINEVKDSVINIF